MELSSMAGVPAATSSLASNKMANAAGAEQLGQALNQQAQLAGAGVEGNSETPSTSAAGATTAPTPTAALPEHLGRNINVTA
ncbi:MAG: hypothetical protein JXM75_12545 [Chromatiaceae bacterium]|nr:hypothetical protein [Chromatiaceae bacterium]